MSYLSSTNIVIRSVLSTGLQNPKGSIFANSPVLDFLLPQLSATQNNEHKTQQLLDSIDSYMLQETEDLLKRINNICLQLRLSDSTTFMIQLGGPGLCISGCFEEKEQLAQLVNRDRWICTTFNWLHANYTALAYSQELLRFSYAYEKNRQQALVEYKHFELHNQGMDCHLNCNVEGGLPILVWQIESPLMVFRLKN